MEERRKLKRQHIMFYSRVFHRETGEFLGYLGNLTPMGMMVITEKPIVAGQRMPLRIDLPEDMYKLPLLKLEARSVWCRRDVDPNFYNVGFELH
ncbi:MAG: PilZ domain-containing protein, partial [Anaerolineae bacterium]